ncbi:MAG: hypothetical protein JXR96_25510 [Deltaproteobacteria bacterium]|nr:hypothetical protein [Deltaproteobacteria bacterium]
MITSIKASQPASRRGALHALSILALAIVLSMALVFAIGPSKTSRSSDGWVLPFGQHTRCDCSPGTPWQRAP